MDKSEKPDAQAFLAHLQALRKSDWLGSERTWWTRYAFHFTDVRNAVSIFKRGELLSRQQLIKESIDFVDAASSEVIQHTHMRWKDFVRLYFRPRTPTLYANEGFSPSSNPNKYNARCPVPIYFLFNLEKLLCQADSRFSDGNLASNSSNVYASGNDFVSLPFPYIYHDSRISEELKKEITNRKNAEVLVPARLSLEDLEIIWCRSQAEYETLRQLLGEVLWSTWKDKVTAIAERPLFFRNWVYVESALLSSTKIVINLHEPSNKYDFGRFHLKIEITESSTGLIYEAETSDFVFSQSQLSYDLSNLLDPNHYSVSFYIDNCLAYSNSYDQKDEIPF
ncbi:MAG: DUF4433 domain-containing protein [Anaerolineae bacterium]|nr:DUF4433 domain-containing protein [Anaerolineae bacterium]